MEVKRFDLANVLAASEGENFGSVWLPPVSPRDPGAVRDEWVQRYGGDPDDCLRQEVRGGKFMVYRMRVDKEPCSLVTFLGDDGGFDGTVLVDGFVNSISEGFEVWMGSDDLVSLLGHPMEAFVTGDLFSEE